MPIPSFSQSGVLPSYIPGHATLDTARSPFQASMLELVDRFCTSKDRASLLKGLNHYRKHLRSGGFVSGYQWIDGSFIENVELLRNRSPKDIDVFTFFHRPVQYQVSPNQWPQDYENFLRDKYFNTKKMKPIFNCDTYDGDLDAGPRAIVRNSTYWFGLFSDVRDENFKKGFVEIPLPNDSMEFLAVDQTIEERFNV